MNDYDSLTEGFSGLAKDDPGPLSDEENQKLEQSIVPGSALSGEGGVKESSPARRSADVASADAERMSARTSPPAESVDEPPHDPDDWPEDDVLTAAAVQIEDLAMGPGAVWPEPTEGELRVLRGDELPLPGAHYVIFNGVPKPVTRSNYQVSEDEHVATQIGGMEGLKDADGNRHARAERTLRMRYRGYLCGEMTTL